MKKIAVLGKPANGKSTLSKELALATGIKLYVLDSVLYKPNGEEVNRATYEEFHEGIISSDEWIIEGFGPMNLLDSFYPRLEALPQILERWFLARA